MKFISILVTLIAALFQVSNAAAHLEEDPKIKYAIEKFHTDYERLRAGFTETLSQRPLGDPSDTIKKVKSSQYFYSNAFLLHIQCEDYWNSFLAGKVDIEHILGLAKVLKVWKPNSTSGFTQQNVYFLSQVLQYHHAKLEETMIPLKFVQDIAEELKYLRKQVANINAQNARLRTALEQSGIELWP